MEAACDGDRERRSERLRSIGCDILLMLLLILELNLAYRGT